MFDVVDDLMAPKYDIGDTVLVEFLNNSFQFLSDHRIGSRIDSGRAVIKYKYKGFL